MKEAHVNRNEINRLIAVSIGMKPRIMTEQEYDDLYANVGDISGWLQIYDGDELIGDYTTENYAGSLNSIWSLFTVFGYEDEAYEFIKDNRLLELPSYAAANELAIFFLQLRERDRGE